MIFRSPLQLGAFVRQARLDLGWSQQELADQVGTSRPWVSRFETAKAEVDVGRALRTLHVLGYTVRIEKAEPVEGIDLHEILGIEKLEEPEEEV